MNLHEYQAKQLFSDCGLPVPDGHVCDTPQQVVDAAAKLDAKTYVVKCQVHAGGRGKAGGVLVTSDKDELKSFAQKWLGQRLVTNQTDAQGQPVNKVLLEKAAEIARELYLGAVIDRATQRVVFMASTEGGMDIEAIAEQSPHLIHSVAIDPLVGPQPYQARQLAFKLDLNAQQLKQFVPLFCNLANMFTRYDFSLLEINPLVVTTQGDLLCVDGKVNIDTNALYRQPRLREMHDPTQDDEREAHAAKWDLNYVALDGSIGCMVNGAGLAMGTMDIVQLYGGSPANFLDVGGGATKERVSEAFKIILSDDKVKAVLVNIFGGIVRCDLIAQGIVGAVSEVGVNVPVVVRLEGNNAELGRQLLAESGLNIIAASSLRDAAQRAVIAAGGEL